MPPKAQKAAASVLRSLISSPSFDIPARPRLPQPHAWAAAFDPTTVTCTDTSLTSQAEGLIQGLESPLLGKISILNAANFRPNPAYGTTAKDLADFRAFHR
jgi:hypothetical protein